MDHARALHGFLVDVEGGDVVLQGLLIEPGAVMVHKILFLAVTGFIAWHGIRYRTEEGKMDVVRLLFGCIAATFFFLVLFQDVLGVVSFG